MATRVPGDGGAEALLARSDPAALMERVVPGFRFDDEELADVVLIGSPAVHPVVVVVDEPGRTLIAHPPLTDGEPTDAAARLRLLARAAGDHTRIRILQELRPGPRTCPTSAGRSTARARRCSTTSPCCAPPASSTSPSRMPSPTSTASTRTASPTSRARSRPSRSSDGFPLTRPKVDGIG